MNPLLFAVTLPLVATSAAPATVSPDGEAEVSVETAETPKERLVYAPLVADRALRKMAERLDGSLVVRFREIAPFELIVPTEEEALDPAIARLLRFGCRDISCVSTLAKTYDVEKVIMGQLRSEGSQIVLSLKVVEHKRGMELREVSLEGRREAQLVEQLSAAVGRLSEDEAAAAALEAEVAAENARMQPKPMAERVQEQMAVGLPRLMEGLTRGWTPQLVFSANERRWGLGLGVEWDLPATTNSLVLDLSYAPDSPCLCEGGNFSAYGLDFELGLRRYLWRKGPVSSTSKPDHSGLFLDGHYRRGQLSWTQEGGIPISRSRSQWGLGLGWRHVLDARGLTSTLRVSGDMVTGNESPAAWGSEVLLWRGVLGFGYRL